MNIIEVCNSNKKRILTGLALILVAGITAFLDSFFVTWAILGVAYMVGFYEAMKLFKQKDDKLYVYAVAVWLSAFFYPHPTDLIFIVLIVAVAMMAHKKEVNFKKLAPFFYPSISMLFLLTLYESFGMSVLVWLVVIVALTDTAAYFVGKSMGKTKFSPTSPNKTWEGVIGGVIIASIVGGFVGSFYYPFWFALVTSFFVSASSIWGDLFESYLKREAGVKDSGGVFPGHGGLLDRLDGYLFGVVVMVVILRGFH